MTAEVRDSADAEAWAWWDAARAVADRLDPGEIALVDQLRCDADNLRHGGPDLLDKPALAATADHMEWAATKIAGPRP